MKLYHATFQSYLSDIEKRGLLPGQRKNWEDCLSGYVYFANDPDVAISFCEAAEDTPADVSDSGICCFEIDLKDLNPELLTDDPNILEEADGAHSGCYAYAGAVSYNKLHLHWRESPQNLNEGLSEYYGFERGVLLTKADPEFEYYSCNNPSLPYGFYDECQGFCASNNLEKMRTNLRKYVEDGVDMTYAIVSFQGVDNDTQIKKILEDEDIGAMDYTFFKNKDDIKYSVCKIDGQIIEGFLEKLIEAIVTYEPVYMVCKYVSSWDGFGEVSSPAKYDPINNKVYDVELADLSDDDLAECEILVGEYMDLSGTRFVLGERSFDDTWTVEDPNPLCVISSIPDLRSKASLASKIQLASARVVELKPIVHASTKDHEIS